MYMYIQMYPKKWLAIVISLFLWCMQYVPDMYHVCIYMYLRGWSLRKYMYMYMYMQHENSTTVKTMVDNAVLEQV